VGGEETHNLLLLVQVNDLLLDTGTLTRNQKIDDWRSIVRCHPTGEKGRRLTRVDVFLECETRRRSDVRQNDTLAST
jgi:hypothetical protein